MFGPTFGTKKQTIMIDGNEVEVMSGGITKESLPRELIEGELGKLPHTLQEKLLEAHRRGCGIIVNEVSALRGDTFKGQFYFSSGEEHHILLGVNKGSIDPEIVYHELVHWEQWKRGDLSLDSEGAVHWKGVASTIASGSGRDYRFSPWEREAYARQYAWAYKEKVSSLKPEMRVALDRLQLSWIGFMHSPLGMLLTTLFLVGLLTVIPGGWWWFVKAPVAVWTVLQAVGVVASLPVVGKWAEGRKSFLGRLITETRSRMP